MGRARRLLSRPAARLTGTGSRGPYGSSRHPGVDRRNGTPNAHQGSSRPARPGRGRRLHYLGHRLRGLVQRGARAGHGERFRCLLLRLPDRRRRGHRRAPRSRPGADLAADPLPDAASDRLAADRRHHRLQRGRLLGRPARHGDARRHPGALRRRGRGLSARGRPDRGDHRGPPHGVGPGDALVALPGADLPALAADEAVGAPLLRRGHPARAEPAGLPGAAAVPLRPRLAPLGPDPGAAAAQARQVRRPPGPVAARPVGRGGPRAPSPRRT